MAKYIQPSENERELSPILFRRGWVLFLAGLGVSVLIATFIRTSLSPAQIRFWVEEALQRTKLPVQVEFSEIQLKFSQGWLPWFGLVAKDVTVLSLDSCQSLSEFRTDRLDIPLSVMGLFKNKIIISTLSFGESHLRHMPGQCESDRVQVGSESVMESPSGLPVDKPLPKPEVEIKNLIPRKFNLSLGKKFPLDQDKLLRVRDEFRQRLVYWQEQVVPSLRAINVPRLEIVDGRYPDWTLTLDNFRLAWREKEGREGLNISSRVQFGGQGFEGQVNRPLLFQLFMSPDQMDLLISGNYKEGVLKWAANFDWTTFHTDVALEHQQIPLSPILQILKAHGVVTNELQPKYLWVSCNLSYKGGILELEKNPVVLDPCSINGDIGEIAITDWRWHVWRNPVFDPLILDLKNLDLQKLVTVIGRTGPSGILSKFGSINGRVVVTSPNQMQFAGDIRNVELAFSNQGVRGKQPVALIKGELELKDERVTGNLSEVVLDQGEFAGQLSFNLDRNFRQGILQIAIDSLGFNSSIQNLMIGGEISPLSIYGQGKIEGGDLVGWRGDVGVSNLNGNNWSVSGIKLSSELTEGRFSSQLKAKDILLPPGGSFYRLLRPLFLDVKKADEGLQFTQLTGKVKLSKESGSWEKVSVKSFDKISMTSSGQWDLKNQIEGAIKVNFPVLKLMQWDLNGTLERIQVQPSPKMLKILAKRRPDLNIPESMEIIRSGEMLVKEISSQSVEKIKSLSKKVLETARKIIPEGSSSEAKEQANGETNEIK